MGEARENYKLPRAPPAVRLGRFWGGARRAAVCCAASSPLHLRTVPCLKNSGAMKRNPKPWSQDLLAWNSCRTAAWSTRDQVSTLDCALITLARDAPRCRKDLVASVLKLPGLLRCKCKVQAAGWICACTHVEGKRNRPAANFLANLRAFHS